MPVKITSVGKGKFQVATPNGVKAKGTSYLKAIRQERLLNAVKHGWKPTQRRAAKP